MTLSKRLFDVILSLLLLALLWPVLVLLIGLALLLEGRPVFYISERMRSPTQGFGLIKLRTMPMGSGDGGVTGGNKQRQLSRFHRILRKSRADELPQLWNVLRGDISLVGPRPPLRTYVDAYPALYARVLTSRPGITGLASVVFADHEGRLLATCETAAETDAVYRRRCIPRKAALDLIYQKRRNLCFDLVLIGRTAAKPFRGK